VKLQVSHNPELDRLKYPFHKYEDDIVSNFADLNSFRVIFTPENLPSPITADLALKYVILMYDPGSPGQSIPDLKRRRVWAMQTLNFEPPYDEAIDDMLRWKIVPVNKMATVFLYIIGGEKYAVWKQAEVEMLEIIESKIEYNGDDIAEVEKYTKIQQLRRTNLTLAAETLEKARHEFLQGEKSLELDRELTTFTLMDTLGLEPEIWVERYVKFGQTF